jgi:hypothetical protein
MAFPVLPEDLSALTDDELAELEAQFVAAFQEASPNARTPEQVAELSGLADATDLVRAEGAARVEAAAALAEQVAALSLRVVGEDGDGEDDTEDDDEEPETPEAPAEPAGPAEVEPGTGPANPTPAANPETGEAPAPTARAAAAGRPSLAAMAARVPARMAPRADLAAVGRVKITASPDIPGYAMGQQFNSLDDIAAAMVARRQNLAPSTGGVGDGDKIPVARFTLDIPEDRQLSPRDTAEQNMAKVARFTQDKALVAAGGLCAPVAGYYDQLIIAEAMRPVRDALPTFGAERGGIRFNPPPTLSQVTQGVGIVSAAQDSGGNAFTDGATTSGSATVTSATAAFTQADVGRTISGAGIPAGATIVAVGSATSITMSANATATASGVTITIGRGSKATFIATCAAISEVDVQAIYTSIQFGNWTNRTFPELVAAWTKLAAAVWAPTPDQALLDGIAAGSTAVTSAGLVGGAREVLARLGQAANGYRSRNRMAIDAPLTVLAPMWLPGLMQADLARSFTDDPDLLGIATSVIEGLLAARNINVAWYMDSKTGGNQVFAAQALGVLNQFPALIYMYMFAEGTFLRLDAGTLDLGLVRDSVLNAQNQFRMFSESWENVAKVGPESLEIALTAYPDGTYGAAKAVTDPIVT